MSRFQPGVALLLSLLWECTEAKKHCWYFEGLYPTYYISSVACSDQGIPGLACPYALSLLCLLSKRNMGSEAIMESSPGYLRGMHWSSTVDTEKFARLLLTYLTNQTNHFSMS